MSIFSTNIILVSNCFSFINCLKLDEIYHSPIEDGRTLSQLNRNKKFEVGLKNIDEFLYYVEGVLVAYLGISSFGGSNIGEINGITHPDYRRKGLFRKLFELAVQHGKGRGFSKILLLSDANSGSGLEFIKSANGIYDFSEYRMKVIDQTTIDSIDCISLRKATNLDGKEIGRQNAVFFNESEECEAFLEEEEKLNEITYMAQVKGEIIGKIRVEYSDNSAFISGFGLLPNFRGKGYGKATLKGALQLINEKNICDIELDVECKNNTALNLYKSCGFKEKSVMNYYKYDL
ncbi:GNAT family N-acetyltransferase [Clostridium frigoris]|uniref:GNAT family N-acetyltransferase n=1 Tax=Clostridium frigoris TaxID=205327 RepID=A0ABS6BWY9_9CLOT|nr:GNAT family N-acetyltransferase [Clostridium frigoris]MBU3161079.1 GNAT family N-acetyltransferase [Clostridium frigoris]